MTKKGNILFYTSFTHVEDAFFKGKTCWVPNSDDARIAIEYAQSKLGFDEICVEDKLISQLNLSQKFNTITLDHQPSEHKKIALYAQSDTLAHSSAQIYQALLELGVEVTLLVPGKSTEKAHEFFDKNKLPYQAFTNKLLKSLQPDVFLVLNDWTKEVHRIFAYCKQLNIPTVCLQESIIDFGDSMRRMLYADNVMVQGVQTLNELDRKHYFITGNPRYTVKRDNRRGNQALINCNFTYGIFEDARENWLGDIQGVLEHQAVDYRITQHPRDKGDIAKFGKVIGTNSQSLPAYLEDSSFLITRFSSLIHEAIAVNVPVIYYNPHGEQMKYDFGCNSEFLWYATNQSELEKAVVFLKNYEVDTQKMQDYLAVHCVPKEQSANKTIASLLHHFPFQGTEFKASDLKNKVLYYPTVLNFLKKIKGSK